MYIDRHRVAELIALSAVAVRSAAERDLYRDHLEVLLANLYNGATPAAREAFLKHMNAVPADQKPWAAVMRPEPARGGLGAPVPPVVTLLLRQIDDEPDAADDGNRLPDRESPTSAAWLPLYAALERWDTAAILRHIGPLGWDVPEERRSVPVDEGVFAELMPAQAVPAFASARPPRFMQNTNGQPGAPPVAPAPPLATVTPFWQKPAVLVAGGVIVALSFSAIGVVIGSRKEGRALPGVRP